MFSPFTCSLRKSTPVQNGQWPATGGCDLGNRVPARICDQDGDDGTVRAAGTPDLVYYRGSALLAGGVLRQGMTTPAQCLNLGRDDLERHRMPPSVLLIPTPGRAAARWHIRCRSAGCRAESAAGRTYCPRKATARREMSLWADWGGQMTSFSLKRLSAEGDVVAVVQSEALEKGGRKAGGASPASVKDALSAFGAVPPHLPRSQSLACADVAPPRRPSLTPLPP